MWSVSKRRRRTLADNSKRFPHRIPNNLSATGGPRVDAEEVRVRRAPRGVAPEQEGDEDRSSSRSSMYCGDKCCCVRADPQSSRPPGPNMLAFQVVDLLVFEQADSHRLSKTQKKEAI